MPLVSTLLALHRRLYIAGAEYNHKVYEVDWILNVLNAETKPIQGVGKGVLPKKIQRKTSITPHGPPGQHRGMFSGSYCQDEHM